MIIRVFFICKKLRSYILLVMLYGNQETDGVKQMYRFTTQRLHNFFRYT